ncbi:uncharacterized protein LOC119193826 [Manduca sexta]|uniref:uncharacterized protein LOC119193826 n=1 Tax=Manduca sexta TaxID=7130 RepID=UPI00188DE7C8|nr:uncharacterized protein LOC119193826 [Manduca sexta]
MADRRKVLKRHQIENALHEMFSSEDESDEHDNDYTDYVPKSLNARLNDIQGMSNRQLLLLDGDARQSYEESPNEEVSPCFALSVPSPDFPEVLAPAVDEEIGPYVPLSAPLPDFHTHPEMFAPAVDEEISPCVPMFAPLPDLPTHPEMLAPAVNEEMAPCITMPGPSSGLPANIPTYAELQARDRTWTTDVENFDELNFGKEIEPTKSYSYQSLPIEYFSNLFPDEIFEMIVEYTNKYAKLKQSKFWSDTHVDEIKAFLAIIILMGINPQSDIELYWSADPFYNNIEISGTMTSKRFKKILENFQLNF